MLSFFPRGVLDEILNLIESVSEGFPSYSFMPGDSTVNQLVDVYDTFCKALDEGKEVSIPSLEIWLSFYVY